MSAFSRTSFSESAFDPDAFSFGDVIPSSDRTGHGGQKKPQPYPFDKDWTVEVDRPEAPVVEALEAIPVEERRRAVPPVAVEQLAEHNAKLEFELSGIRTIEAQLRQSLELKRKRDQQERDDEEALFRLGVFD